MKDNGENILISSFDDVGHRVIVDKKGAIKIQTNGNVVARFTGVYNGGSKPKLDIHTVRGSTEDPKVLRPGDYGMNMSFTTFFEQDDGDIAKSIATLVPQVDESANINHPAPASNLNILVNAGDGEGEYANDYRVWRFNKDGALQSKIFQCVKQNNETINKIEPKNGMIIYNEDIDKFQGYANGSWIDLH